MKKWLADQWYVVVVLVIFAIGTAYIALTPPTIVQAAPAPTSVCEAVATAGNITVYYCEPEYGLPFYVNSVGFMALED